eukprot:SAG31_NODE_33509_length_343_cov_0.631148_1_plen_57_part_01
MTNFCNACWKSRHTECEEWLSDMQAFRRGTISYRLPRYFKIYMPKSLDPLELKGQVG